MNKYLLAFLFSGKYFLSWVEKFATVKRTLPIELKGLYTDRVANAVIFMVVEFSDGTIEVVPESWGFRPSVAEGKQSGHQKPMIVIPPILVEVRKFSCLLWMQRFNLCIFVNVFFFFFLLYTSF